MFWLPGNYDLKKKAVAKVISTCLLVQRIITDKGKQTNDDYFILTKFLM